MKKYVELQETFTKLEDYMIKANNLISDAGLAIADAIEIARKLNKEGLAQELVSMWYSLGLQSKYIRKLIQELEDGNI